MGETERDPDLSLIDAVVTAATERASDGRLFAPELAAIVDELELPARLYRTTVDAVARSGVTVADEVEDAVSGDVHEPGTQAEGADGFDSFVRRAWHPVLTQAEEQELGVRIDRGRLADQALAERADELDWDTRRALRRQVADGHQAEDELATHNVRLVMSIAEQFKRQCTPSFDYEDLVQEGYFGLARAIAKWEHTRGLKFSTYATWWIRQRMQRSIADKARSIRLPVHVHESLRKVLRAEREQLAAGERATPRSIAAAVGMSEGRVRKLLGLRGRIDSLDRVVSSGDTTLGQFVAASNGTGPERHVEETALRRALDDVLSQLTPRERLIIVRRFGLDGTDRVSTLEEIGQEMGVTRERIRQIEVKALKKLRHPTRRAVLRDFAEWDMTETEVAT